MKTRSLLLLLPLLILQFPVHAEELRARLEWAHSVDLRAFESGIVEQVNVLEGQSVNKGDVLVRLDPRDFELMIQTASARLKQAEAILDKTSRELEWESELYDQGLMLAGRDRLACEAPGMGAHEAQARLWENHVGRSLAFWQGAVPDLRELFPEAAVGFDAAAMHRAVNRVRLSPVRIASDELTYHLHILMRYELELLLLRGDLTVGELPEAWNTRSKELLGLVPARPREGRWRGPR